jgi:hypothetical protein
MALAETHILYNSDAPARLKNELDTVLNLQGDLDTVEKTLQNTRVAISTAQPTQCSLKILKKLERSHDDLKEEVERLYASLNIHDSFPELQGINLDFVRTLLMARDLKINIRKRAIGSFFEWEKLDQAVGGREEALGRPPPSSDVKPFNLCTFCRYKASSAHSEGNCQTQASFDGSYSQIQWILCNSRDAL